MHIKEIRTGNHENIQEDNKNLFKSMTTASIVEVADWQLKLNYM